MHHNFDLEGANQLEKSVEVTLAIKVAVDDEHTIADQVDDILVNAKWLFVTEEVEVVGVTTSDEAAWNSDMIRTTA